GRWFCHDIFNKQFFCHFATSFMISSRFTIPTRVLCSTTTRLLTCSLCISPTAYESGLTGATVITGLVITSPAVTGIFAGESGPLPAWVVSYLLRGSSL